MRPFIKLLLPIVSILFVVPSNAQTTEEIEPIPVGNFSLPFSQQPGPFVSFGENILDQGQLQLYVLTDAVLGKNTLSTDLIPSFLYGITDSFSLFFNVPFTPENKNKSAHSSGLEDIWAQFEYAFFTKKTLDSIDQATIVANITFPTGSSEKNPPTGLGSCSFFIGGTYMHMLSDWFVFTSPGAIFTTSHHGEKFGNQLLYQFGFGRNIPSPSGWIFAWMAEFEGFYVWKDKMNGTIDPNSGGNTIYLVPSLWISSNKIILQLGAGYPIVQHLFGDQPSNFLLLQCNFGYAF
jgi:hypothetical protein